MIQWDAALELGVETLDKQHKGMVGLANRLFDAHRQGSRDEIALRMRDLVNAATQHFKFEEQMMAQAGYEGAEVHGDHHAEVLAELDRFSGRLRDGHYAGQNEKALAFLATWVKSHITTFDRDFADYLARRHPAGA
jgi:hemerythrin-like metal-binding protein